jgi:hypothetical protein
MNTPDAIDFAIAEITALALAKFCEQERPIMQDIEQFVSDINDDRFQFNHTFVVEISGTVWRKTRPDSYFRQVAKQAFTDLQANTEAFYGGLDYKTFSLQNRAIWDRAEEAGCSALVRYFIRTSPR